MSSAVAERTALDAAHAVAAALGARVTAAYAVGSVALGDFRPGSSDVDIVAVAAAPLSRAEKEEIVAIVREVDFEPARGLELVVYSGGEVALNVNVGPGMVEHVGYEPADEPQFWFVLDRAVGQEHAVALVGPTWSELFPRVSRDEVLAALEESLRWHEEHEPESRNAVLNALRARWFVRTGEWISKPAAARALRDETRAELEAAR